MYNDQRVNSRDSRPSSITRSIRGSFSSELEVLPPEKIDQNVCDLEINEEIASEIDEEIEGVTHFNLESYTQGSPVNTASTSSTPDAKKEESDLERKIRRGLKKIDKLDKILIQKIQKEKEIKRENLALQRDFQKQVQTLIEDKGVENVIGCQQLLSLCAAAEGINESQDIESDEAYIGPIFATQIDSEFYKDQQQGIESQNGDRECENGEADGNAKKKNTDKNQRKVDLIKRNITLAAHANEAIALTDEERKRLDELLADDNDLLIGENPFSTPILKDDGFQFSIQDQRSLEEIDEKLREFMPDVDFDLDSVLSQSQTSIMTNSQSGETSGDASIILGDKQTGCGEKVLDDGQNARNMVLRLNEIETKLNDLRLRIDTPISETIDPDLLRSLLEVDSRMTSDSKSICDSLRSHSQLISESDDVSELLSVMFSQDRHTDLSISEANQAIATEGGQ